MRRTHALCLAVIVCLAWNSVPFAQKGGRPKPTDQPVTAWFGINAALSGPSVDTVCLGSGPGTISGDGDVYLGSGSAISSGSGAFLRTSSDGEFVLRASSSRASPTTSASTEMATLRPTT